MHSENLSGYSKLTYFTNLKCSAIKGDNSPDQSSSMVRSLVEVVIIYPDLWIRNRDAVGLSVHHLFECLQSTLQLLAKAAGLDLRRGTGMISWGFARGLKGEYKPNMETWWEDHMRYVRFSRNGHETWQAMENWQRTASFIAGKSSNLINWCKWRIP